MLILNNVDFGIVLKMQNMRGEVILHCIGVSFSLIFICW